MAGKHAGDALPAEALFDEVLFERRGRLGVITLNRPQAVNALTAGMASAMLEQLTLWADDDAVAAVLVRGAGDRGLCAGGDIVAIYRDMLDGGDATADFWAEEYRLNSLISGYPKPYVAFMDGLVLGGGVGISAHGSVRIVTERTRIGMPETTIGFVPDVGGTLLLSRSPGESGTHAALTGAHLSGADALFLGLADHFVPSGKPGGAGGGAGNRDGGSRRRALRGEPPASALAGQREWIDACYSSDDAEEILRRLRALAASRGSCRRGRHDRGQVPDRGEGGAGIPAPGPRAEPRGSAGAGIPGGPALPRGPRLPRGHPGAGGGQGPQPALAARHPRGGGPRRRRGLLRAAGRP